MSNVTGVSGADTGDAVWNITEVIEQQALRHPAAPALITPDRVMSYGELVAGVHGIARQLLVRGVRPGQTLGVSMAQTPLHLMTLLAIARIGAVSVPVHVALPVAQRHLAAQRFNVSAIVSGRPDMQLQGISFIALNGIDLSAPGRGLPPAHTKRDDPCWIALSSGTSGDPKGVLRSHGYLLDRVGQSSYERTRQSRLLPMDLNFGVGFGQSMRMLVAGGTVVLVPTNAPADLAYMVRAHAVSHWLLSPAIAENILPLLTVDDIHFSSVVHLQIVGAAPSRRLLDALFRRFTPNVFVAYGTTEVGPVAVATPDMLRRAPETVGQVVPWVQLEIVDEHDQPLPPGQSGRLRLKAQGMFDSYYLDPALTADRFRNGWHYPRDRARLDADGLLYIEGREDDVINVGGQKIYYRDIEKIMQTHPAVREAAVFTHTDATGREALAMAVIATTRIPIEELQAWAAPKLGPHCPGILFYVDDLPRTATGKVLGREVSVPLAR